MRRPNEALRKYALCQFNGVVLLRGHHACEVSASGQTKRLSTDGHPTNCRCRECQRIRLLRARADKRLELFANR